MVSVLTFPHSNGRRNLCVQDQYSDQPFFTQLEGSLRDSGALSSRCAWSIGKLARRVQRTRKLRAQNYFTRCNLSFYYTAHISYNRSPEEKIQGQLSAKPEIRRLGQIDIRWKNHAVLRPAFAALGGQHPGHNSTFAHDLSLLSGEIEQAESRLSDSHNAGGLLFYSGLLGCWLRPFRKAAMYATEDNKMP